MRLKRIVNGTLIDGRGGAPVAGAALLIEGERIRAAGGAEEVSGPAEASGTSGTCGTCDPIEEIDAGGGFILPGFIDAHVHLMVEGFDVVETLTSPLSLQFYKAIRNMRRTLDAGITSVRDAAGADLGLKRAVEQGLVQGPRLQVSLTALTITGGHNDFWMPSGNDVDLFPAYPGRPSGRCDGVEEVRRKVREVLRAGADVIKVCATGGIISPSDHPEYTQFTPEELAVMVQEAAYHGGRKVMAHAQGNEGIKNAVRAGVHSIEHGFHLDREAIDLMLERGTFLVPTLMALAGVLEAAKQPGRIPKWMVEQSKVSFDAQRESIRRAYEAGVAIALGTDTGGTPHGANLNELALMHGVGMKPMDAIVAGTRAAAGCLGWEDRVGTLEAGKLADVIVTRRDPLADIRSLADAANITLVMKGGEVVKDTRQAVQG